MDRKEFLRNSLLATGAILLPNAIWAFDKNFNAENRSLNKFVSKPNLKRFKVSELGTKFFETELSIMKPKTDFKLHRKFFISENINGICTPTLLESDRKESLVFIPELYKDKKHNGFIVKVCENGICEETKLFTHENQGYYAFWGKEYLGNPTLYHYNVDTCQLMRIHKENGVWLNHIVMPMNTSDIKTIYNRQLKNVEHGQLTQQYGHDFEIHKDGFYQFLALKNSWEQGIITKEKEKYEKENPAEIYSTGFNLSENKLNVEEEFSYTYPFVPIYCEGDDLTYAITKPKIIYEEVVGTKIEIPDMPAYKSQDSMGECRAFALATILQWYTCKKWKADIPDCKNPPADSAISHFGMLAHTNLSVDDPYKTFQPNQDKARGMRDIINDLSENGTRVILESCKPFDNLLQKFDPAYPDRKANKNIFFTYLKNIYESNKNKTEVDLADCMEYVIEINNLSGLNIKTENLKKAMTKDHFDKFTYSLFFGDCTMEAFPSGYRAMAYPTDDTNAMPIDIKNKIIEGLSTGRPVLFPSLCVSQNKGDECTMFHSLVISGYKKICKKGDTTNCKDVIKLHNSWGVAWQKENNEGWVDADIFVQNTSKIKSKDGTYRIGSQSVIWIEP